MACSLYNKPKFIVLDECETLTETAQLALRPLLEYKTDELCLIFICNSLTRVQKPLMNHFLQIRFNPPTFKQHTTIDTIEWRNDYRKQKESSKTSGLTEFINYLLSSPKYTPKLVEFEYDISRTLRWCALLAYELDIEDPSFHSALIMLSNPDINIEHTHDLQPILDKMFAAIRCKFDDILSPI